MRGSTGMEVPFATIRSQMLCQLVFEHAYFVATRFGDRVRLEPGEGSLRQGIEVRDAGQSFWVFRRERYPGEPPPSRVSLGIRVLDPDFFSYTRQDGPEAAPGPDFVAYLNPARVADGSPILKGALSLPVRPRRFLHRITRPLRDLTGMQLGPIGGTLEPVSLTPSPSHDNLCPVNAEGVDSEGCEAVFQYSDGQSESFRCVASDLWMSRVPHWMFEWELPPSLDEGPPTFQVRFEARATIWRYFVTGIPTQEWGSTSIRPVQLAGRSIEFEAVATSGVTPEGSPVLTLQSTSPLPLSEAPSFRIILQSNSNLDGQSLPYPGREIVRCFDETGNSIVCSDVYVRF